MEFFKIKNFGSLLAGFQVLKNLIYIFFSFGFSLPTLISNKTMCYCLLVEDGSTV